MYPSGASGSRDDGRVRHGEGLLFELPALVRRHVGEASDIRGSQFAERRGEIRIQRDRLLEELDRAFVVLVGGADAEIPRPQQQIGSLRIDAPRASRRVRRH